MGLSFLTQELAMDLGTANTIIFQNDQIVLDEPSIVAIENASGKCMALGSKAKMMHERTSPGIKTVRPLRDGVIADFNAAEMMIKGFIKQVNSKRHSLFNPNLKIVVGIPSGSTEVEIRAVRDSTEHAGGREVYLIFEPMASALGIGLDVEAPKGNMVVDIGGGTTEIAVISLGGIVVQDSIRTAGDVFTKDIQEYLRQQYNIKVGEITAEKIKIAVGAVIQDLDEEPEPYEVKGPNLITAHPVNAVVGYQEIAQCLDKTIVKIENAIIQALEQTPPELYSDIVENGIYLAGNTGSGKTLAMTIIRKLYPLFPFVDAEGVKVRWLEKRADEITEIYARSGEIQQFKQSPLLCIQDLGCEPNEASFMGNKLNVLQNIIEYRGDQPNKVTVVTSNIPLGHSDIASRYGERAQSRMVEMMNYLILTGKDRRYNIETK